MTQAHPALADQFTALRATLTAAPQGGMLHAALHLTGVWALFAAVFLRLLDRLEAMLRLWQAGQFPPPPSPRAPSRRRLVARAARKLPQPRRRARIARAVLRARAVRSANPRRATLRADSRASPRAAAPRTARRKPAARAPPSPHAP